MIESTVHADYALGAVIADQLMDAVGIGITPLLGMGVLGAARWFAADAAARGFLPWYQQPWFWSPLLTIVVIGLVGGRIPGVARVLKAWKLWENKFAALLSIPVIGSMAIAAVDAAMNTGAAPAPSGAPAAAAHGGALLASAPPAPLAWIVAAASIAVLLVVLVVKNAIDVLILINPFPPLDWVLRGLKYGPLAAMLLAALLAPWLGAGVAALVLLACLLLFAWSMRLSIMGSVFARDILFLRWRVPPDPAQGFPAFSGRALPLPRRTYGRVVATAAGPVFRTRRWFIGPHRDVTLPPGQVQVVRGMLLGPDVAVRPATGGRLRTAAWCAPAVRSHEELLATSIGAGTPLDCALVRGLRAAWEWVFGGSDPEPAAP